MFRLQISSAIRVFSLLILSLFLISISEGKSYAGAWVQGRGDGLSITTIRWYESGKRWDSERELSDSPDYRKLELNPYIEYGFTERLTVGANVFVLDIDAEEDSAGLSDVEVLARYSVYTGAYDTLSVQGLIKIPGPYDTDLAPGLGQGQFDFEARLLYGTGGPFADGSWYANFEGGVRKRLEESADELRLDWTLGYKKDRWELELKQENILGLRNSDNASDYDLHKLTPSVRYWFNEKTGLQAGVSRDVYGRNTGKGTSVIAAFWIRF